MKVVPAWAVEWMPTLPSWARAISRTMNSPRPTPRLPLPLAPRIMGSNSVACSGGGIGGPSLCTSREAPIWIADSGLRRSWLTMPTMPRRR